MKAGLNGGSVEEAHANKTKSFANLRKSVPFWWDLSLNLLQCEKFSFSCLLRSVAVCIFLHFLRLSQSDRKILCRHFDNGEDLEKTTTTTTAIWEHWIFYAILNRCFCFHSKLATRCMECRKMAWENLESISGLLIWSAHILELAFNFHIGKFDTKSKTYASHFKSIKIVIFLRRVKRFINEIVVGFVISFPLLCSIRGHNERNFIWLWSCIGIAVWSNIKNCREINEEKNMQTQTRMHTQCSSYLCCVWWFSHHNMEIIEQKNWLNSLKFIENICPRAWFVLWPCMHLDTHRFFAVVVFYIATLFAIIRCLLRSFLLNSVVVVVFFLCVLFGISFGSVKKKNV